MKSRRGAALCFGLAVAASVGLLLSLVSRLSFVADDWELLVKRPGLSAGSLLDPFNEHFILVPGLFYKALLATFGMGSALPFFVVSVGLFALTAVLLYVYLRRRLDEWLALILVVPLLFLGAASEDLLWAFQMGFFGATAAGMGMLLALEREDRRGDRVACLLLLVALSFSGLGIPFAFAAAVDLGMGRRPRRRRAYVLLVPLAAFALWWIGWGHTAESIVSLENLADAPRYAFDAAAAGVASLLGRSPVDVHNPGHPPLFSQLLLVAGLVAGTVRIARERRVSRGLAIALALGLGFWVLTGLSGSLLRLPTASRYQYPSALFLLLIAAELLRGVRLPRLVLASLAVVCVAAAAGGVGLLRGESDSWEAMGVEVRAALAAADLAGERANPDFQIPVAGASISDRAYLSAAAKYGTPAYDEAELLARPDLYGEAADATLVAALGIALGSPVRTRPTRCKTIRAADGASPVAVAQGPRLVVENPGTRPVGILVGRFASRPSTALGRLASGGSKALAIPADSSPRAWRLAIAPPGVARVCFPEPVGSGKRVQGAP